MVPHRVSHRVAFHTLGSLLASDGLPHPRLCFVLAAHSLSPLSDSPPKSTKPSQNDCLIILDTPSIPPIRCHRPTQILALAHSFSLPFKYKSSQRHPSTFTKPSQNDCLIILDTPSIPPIRCHRSTQILALAHSFSLPFKYKSSQRLSTQNKNPSQNECFIKRHTPSIPPISLHVP